MPNPMPITNTPVLERVRNMITMSSVSAAIMKASLPPNRFRLNSMLNNMQACSDRNMAQIFGLPNTDDARGFEREKTGAPDVILG